MGGVSQCGSIKIDGVLHQNQWSSLTHSFLYSTVLGSAGSSSLTAKGEKAFNRFLNHPAQISNCEMLTPVWSRAPGMAGIQPLSQSEPDVGDGPGRRKGPSNTFPTFSHYIFQPCDRPVAGGSLMQCSIIVHYSQPLLRDALGAFLSPFPEKLN